jgi:hypothetical protein
MTGPVRNLLLAPLAALALAIFALTPVTLAAPPRGGGGGGARASGGGGARQVDNSRADPRTNNVRSTSSNSVNNVNNANANRNTNVNNTNVNNSNVNVNRNTTVNVNTNNGCCGGWDNDYHPVAGAMAVGAAVAVTSAVIGSMVPSVPPSCVPVNYGGMVYQQCGGTWYQSQGSQFVVVNPPY